MLSSVFISRPNTAIVISLVLTILGAVAYLVLPVERFPDITPPVVNVTANYSGADAETVESTVAAPIEAMVNGVDGMMYMSSTSADNGRYALDVSFKIGTDADIAAVNVQNRVAQATSVLPAEVKAAGVTTQRAASNMLLTVVLYSPDKTYDEVFLSNYASINLKDAIARVPGVGKVVALIGYQYAMRIWMDPQRMAALGLTSGDVIQAVREQNVQVSAGQIGAPPVPGDQQFQYTVKSRGRLTQASEFEQIVVRSGAAGAIVTLGDVARVERGSSVYSTSGSFSGKPATVLSVYQAPGANSLTVSEGVIAEVERLSRSFPDDVVYEIPFNTTEFVEQSVNDVLVTLIMAFALVIAVVFLFLGSLRATLIPAVAIPVSLVGTLAFLYAFGMSLNTVSLFALVLAIGIVVDDAIVVVENVERLMAEEGLSAVDATRKAMGQIVGPVVATTLVLLAVFVPVTFMPGITGRLYSQFAITISTAVVISSINALTLSPALCSIVLKPKQSRPKGPFLAFEWLLDKFRLGYVSVVRRFVRVAFLSLFVIAGFASASVWLLQQTPAGFIPPEDNGYLFVDLQLPDAAALNRTEAVTAKLSDQIRQIEGVEATISINGNSFLNGSAPNGAMIITTLTPWDERQDPNLSADSILAQIFFLGSREPRANVIAFNPPPISGLGRSAGVEMKVQQTGGGSAQELAAALGSMVYSANQREEIAMAYTAFRANVPQLFIDLDREKAMVLQVSISEVFQTLQSQLGSLYVNDFNLFGRVYRVMVQADGDYRNTVGDIGALYVRSNLGEMVRLSTLVDVERILGPTVLQRYNMFRSGTVTGVPSAGLSTGDAIQVLEQEAETALPPGFAFEWTGTAQQQLESAGFVPLILGMAVLFGYLFLVAQYENWIIPVAILLSVIVALFGAILAVRITAGDINLYTQIGILMLIGLGAKNAILIIEFAMERRRLGDTIREAAITSAHMRFRAVMMTALSFLLGVVPLIMASGAGAASQRAIGVAVFGGMLAATVVGVVLIPVLYVALQGFSEWLNRVFGGKSAERATDAQ